MPAIELKFYIGVKQIAEFLGLHLETVKRMLRDGRLSAARRDSMGRWVLTNLDYYRSLECDDRKRSQEKG